MEYQIRLHFKFPSASDAVQLFRDTLYMTQVQQAFCYSMATHFWRRIKDEFVDGFGGTMGIIYWRRTRPTNSVTGHSLQQRNLTLPSALLPLSVRLLKELNGRTTAARQTASGSSCAER